MVKSRFKLLSIAILLLCILQALPHLAYGDNCGSLQDCYYTLDSSLTVLAAIVVVALIIFVAIEVPASSISTAIANVMKQNGGEEGPAIQKPTSRQLVQENNSRIKGSIIELRIGTGLENYDDIQRETSNQENRIIGELTELEEKFSQIMNNILENRDKLKSIERDVQFIEWCEEVRENPNTILSKISEDIIGSFLGSIEPYFQSLILSKIELESEVSVTKNAPKRVRNNITFWLKPIYANIELAVYSDEEKVSSTKLIFAINIYARIKNLTVYLEKVKRRQAEQEGQRAKAPYQDNKVGEARGRDLKRIELENLIIGIKVQFSRMKIGGFDKKIEPPIDLGKKEAGIRKIRFFSQ